ncbi:MAG: sugar phosphate isomerase/epimerase [Opitutus sp.]|nr:sugar phosphate isomerase/epimerase [Opitutus sp.]
MNRRQFVHSTSALATLVALPRPLQAAAASARKLKIALTPGSIGVNVTSQKELNELAHRHRFEAVEPRAEELAGMSREQLAETVADIGTKGLAWAAAGLAVDFRKDDATFRDGLGQLPKIAAGLQRAGVSRVGTWLAPCHAELTYRANYKLHVARLREIARVLQDHGLRFGLEYVGTQLSMVSRKYPFVHTLAEARELIADLGLGHVGLVLDTWHWWTAGDTANDLLTLTNADVVSVDLNDAPKGIGKAQQKDNERELPAATGVIDIAAFLNALITIGYDGPARPEPFNKALNALENDPACAASSAAIHQVMGLIRG